MRSFFSAILLFMSCSLAAQDKGNKFYDSACLMSQKKNIKEAYQLLDSALANGYYKVGWLYVDADLYNIHQDSGWKAYKQILLQKSNIIEPVTRPDLKAIVLDIYEDDQKDRQYAVNNHNLTKEENEKLFNRIKELEKITKVKVANLLNTYGWLTKTMVGTEASEAITFVLIHSDSLPLQIKYLPVLKKAYKKGEAKGMLYAMLKDRIAVIKKIPQAYGSQISYEGGKPHLYKLKKPAGVDKRRKKMGMSLLNDYLKNWKLKWPE